MANKTAYRFFKRLGDILLALPLALLSTPLILFLSILIFCRDPGNPFFLQKRLGYQGSAITVLKLRSMKRPHGFGYWCIE